MKNKIIILCTGFILTGAVQTAFAQQARNKAQGQGSVQQKATPEQRADRRAQLLKAKLMLSDEQAQKVKDASLRQEQSRAADMEKRKSNQDAFEQELRTILNPEQLEKYEAMQEERRDKMKARMEERRTEEKRRNETAPAQKTD